MFKLEIKDKIMQKIEYDLYFLKEFINLYFKLLIYFNKNKDIREKFLKFIKDYYFYTMLEYEILNKIKNIKEDSNLENFCIDIFFELDTIFADEYVYNEIIFEEIEDAIMLNDKNRIIMAKKDYKTLTRELRNEMLKKIII